MFNVSKNYENYVNSSLDTFDEKCNIMNFEYPFVYFLMMLVIIIKIKFTKLTLEEKRKYNYRNYYMDPFQSYCRN